MSENAKRLLSLLMAVSIVVSVLPMSVSAQEQAAVELETTTQTETVDEANHNMVPVKGNTNNDSTNETLTFDFSSLTGQGVEISAEVALATFNGCASGEGLTAVTPTKIYDGNATGGAHPNAAGFIRCGKNDIDGDLVLTFSKKVTKVEVVCHDWYAKIDNYPTNSNYISVNGSAAQLAPYNETGAGETLTFNLDGSSNVVDFDFTNSESGKTGRVFIFKIVVTFEETSTSTYPQLELDVQQNAVISAEGEYAIFAFTPAEDGMYVFESYSSEDTYGYLYDSDMNELSYNDDDGDANNFSIGYSLIANTTYYLKVRFYSNSIGSFPVSVRSAKEAELTSIAFTPVTVIEGTYGYDYGDFWYYYPSELLINSTYTAAFADGTVLTGSNSGFSYEGVWYSFDYSNDQSAENPWTAGNTYVITVTVLGQTAELPVTIIENPLQSISFTPITVIQETNGHYDDDYWYYEPWELLRKSTFTATFTGGTVIADSNSGFYYNDVWYSFGCTSDQSAENPWTAGNPYTITVTVLGQTAEIPVTIVDTPLQSFTFTPVTVIEGTNGEYADGYWHYNEWDLLCNKSIYTATFVDGTEQSGRGSGFYYDGVWYSFDYSSNQSAENPWTAGNIYAITVSVFGQTAEIPVTIIENPLQSLTFTPITVMEGTCGTYDDGYWYYDPQNLLYESTYTATFADGTTLTERDSGFYYDGEWYSFGYSSNQSAENPWTAGNTYAVTVNVMNQTVEIPVTITESPLESISFEPITIVEGMYANNDSDYWHYDLWDLLYYKTSYTATFADGTVIAGRDSGVSYNGWWYSFEYDSDQSSENPWTAGNTYTFTVAILGQVVEVPVTIIENPIVNISAADLCLIEHEGGYWSGDNYCYSWIDQVCYTVTFADGSTQSVVGRNSFYYDGIEYSASGNGWNYDWVVGNTYMETLSVAGREFEVYISIERPVEDNGFEYLIQGEQVFILGCTTSTEILRIPEIIYGYPVTGIVSLGMAPAYAKEIYIPDCVTMLSANALENATGVEKLVLGSGITELPVAMLIPAINLKEICVSEDNSAFRTIDGVLYDKAVTRLIYYPTQKKDLHIIPDSVKDVSALFENDGACSGVNFRLGAGVVGYKEVDGVIYNEDMTRVLYCTAAATGAYVMPESVTQMDHWAFMNSSLTDVTISPNVTQISYWAFKGSAIESITIPGSVQSIDLQAFDGCESLKKVNVLDLAAWCQVEIVGGMPITEYDLYVDDVLANDLVIPENGVTRIKSNVFQGSNLTSVTIPANLRQINVDAFTGCNKLEKVYISDLAAWCNILFENADANPLTYANALYLNGERLKDVVIPEGEVSEIRAYAFYNSNISSVTIPSSVNTIGSWAFMNSKLESITIEEGLTYIGYCAYYGSALKSVDLPDSLSGIGDQGFANCPDLEQVTFGSGKVTINRSTFSGSGLKSLDFPANVAISNDFNFSNTDLIQLNIMDGVTRISYRTFVFNKYLVSVTIPTSLMSIQEYAFEGCDNLSHVLYKGTKEQWGEVDTTSPEILNAIIHYNAGGDELVIQETCTTIQYYCVVCNKQEVIRKDNDHAFVDGVCTICGHEGEWDYYIDKAKGTVTLLDYYGTDRVVTIPSTIEGYPVTGFVANLFAYNKQIKEVTLPETITKIGARAFQDCTFLEKVVITGALTAIGDYAFHNCTKLRSINLPEGLLTIGCNAFRGCDLSEMTIPSTVTSIGEYAFYGCELKQVEIPANVTQIAYYAFAGNYGLEKVTLPDTLQSIGDYAFYGSQITELTIPASVTEIGERALWMYSSGDTTKCLLVFQGDKPMLGEDWLRCSKAVAFYPASSSGWADISVGRVTWYACETPQILKQPAIAEAVIGQSAVFTVEAYGQRLSYQWYLAAPGSEDFTPVGGNNFELAMIVDETTIGSRAYCVVTDVLGQSVQTEIANLEIHNHTFEDGACTGCGAHIGTCGENLTWELDNNGTLTISGNGAMTNYSSSSRAPWYSYRSSIKAVVIEDGVTSIGNYAFAYCTTLSSVTIGKGVTKIGNYAFYSCWNLTRVNITDAAAWCNINFYNTYSNPVYYAKNLYLNGELVTNLVIPDGVSSITYAAFSYCTNLTSINIPDSVTSIGDDAFYDCNSLTSVVIPDSVISIGNGAFQYCGSLKKVIYCGTESQWNKILLGDYNTSLLQAELSYHEFQAATCTTPETCMYCDATQGHPHNPVNNICVDCGIYCGDCGENTYWVLGENGVIYIRGYGPMENYTPGKAPWYFLRTAIKGVVIGNSVPKRNGAETDVTTIGSYAFYGCTKITDVTFGDGVLTIGEGAFYGDSRLTDVVIPDSVTKIGDRAFYACYSLSDVTVGDGVQLIGNYAFEDCYNMSNITLGDNVCVISSGAFSGCANLTAVEIPEQVTFIEKDTFQGCSKLEVVVLPEQMDTIAIGAFSGCDNLTNVYCRGNAADWDEILIAGGNDVLREAAVNWNYEETELPTGCEHVWVDATCATPKSCALCGGESATDRTTKAHTPAEAVRENVTTESCVAGGSYESVVYCSECGAEISRETVVSEAAGHKYDAVVTAPTCTEAGYTTYTCDCGDSYVADEVAALGHKYAGVVTTNPTCTAAGVKTYTCSGCDDSYTEEIAATGHNYVDGACDVCGEKDPNAGPKEDKNLKFLQDPSLSFQDYIGVQTLIYLSTANAYDRVYVEAIQKTPDGDVRSELEGFILMDYFLVFEQPVLSWSMAEEISLTLYAEKNGELYIGQNYTESVETLALGMLEAKSVAGKEDKELCTVLVNMLNYGATVQTVFKHNETQLPNTQLDAYAKYATTSIPEMTASIKKTGTGKVQVLQDSISMQSKVELQMLFAVDLSAYTAKAIVNGEPAEVIMDTEIMGVPGWTVMRVAVSAAQMRETFTIALYDTEGNPVTTVYEVSAEAYAKSLTGDQVDVSIAMMRYGDAVYAYAN